MITGIKKVQDIIIICVFLFLSFSSSPITRGTMDQNSTIKEPLGTIVTYSSGCSDGYTLLNRYTTTILIDMNGTIIHEWPSHFPQPAKMLPGGSLIAGNKFRYIGISCGDFTYLNQYDWNGVITWSFQNWEDNRARQHHDFQREGNPVGYYAPGQDFLPQGNTLILAHHTIRNTSISWRLLKDDVIYEVDWNGTPTGFSWSTCEHINQLGFNNETKHGMYVNPGILGDGDIFHTNSLSLLGPNKWYTEDPITYACFNPENLIISQRHTNIVAIINRTTGDIVWRLGPDYSKDAQAGQKLGQLIGLHHTHMIPQGLPGEGNILLFDNGGWSGYGYFGMPRFIRLTSRVIELNPVTLDIVWEYHQYSTHLWFPRSAENHRFYSSVMCSAQRLPNGNTLVTEGTNARVFEVTNQSTIVWEYLASTRIQQLYRAYRVPPEWVPGNPSGYEFWEKEDTP
ncbi:MAG: aryl-sulfate sulfotransferase [Candidatus Thermoplasmatota archaeon]|jgi:hypothetical protein|nr:aryl-sulfate sulfotransferase [Candidatus Thermoplasmatota archaeon]